MCFLKIQTRKKTMELLPLIWSSG